MIILGISCYYHDSAACLIQDGIVIAAAAEERFSRKKHDNNFPQKAIEFCLNYIGIAANEVTLVAFYEKPIIKFERALLQHIEYFPKSYSTFIETTPSWLDKKLQLKKTFEEKFHYFGKIVFFNHHLAHAASSYYLSNFKKAAIVTIDGVGEWATTTIGLGEKQSIRIDKEIHFPHSLGLLYSTITTYLGFSANDAEYKVMGLAAYGDPAPFRKHFEKLITLYEDGSYILNMEYFDYSWAEHMPSPKLAELFGFPVRKAESKTYSHHEDIAAALQEKLEEVVFHLLKAVHRKYKVDELCLSGGVALNSVMNGKILSRTSFKEIFIPPDPGDAGGAMGAALLAWHATSRSNLRTKNSKKKREKKNSVFSAYLGPEFPWYSIEKSLKKAKLEYELIPDKHKLLDRVSNYLIKQKVIGWYQGRMEWGPRALGNRSILASATKPEMKDIINSRVKHRELFRPFAPVILEKYAKSYFLTDKKISSSAKWMLMVFPFREKMKTKLPAVVHVDGSGRLQTISRLDNPLYYDLIDIYSKKTGIPSIINTSFNVRGEPIVCTPEDAIQCFLKTDIDYLVMDSFLVKKRRWV
jgi:carbamoyltransferase